MRLFALLAMLLAYPAQAAEIPRYVAGPASGLQHECREAKQPVPKLEALVTEIPDIDGDGKPDHIKDAGKGCAAVRLLYCNESGCSLDVYLSSQYGYGGGWKARGYKLDRGTRPARLSILSSGAECKLPAGQECTITLRWNGSELQPVRQ